MRDRMVSVAFSGIMILVAIVHLIYPVLAIDSTFLVLLVIACLPWLSSVMRSLAPLLESIEIPGLKITLRQLEKVGEDAEAVGLIAEPGKEEREQPAYISVAESDPNLALAGLRIEIERRLVLMAKRTGREVERQSAGQLMRFLHKERSLSDAEYSTLQDLLVLLNRAVHGAYVDSNAAQWAIDVGPRIIAALDERVQQLG